MNKFTKLIKTLSKYYQKPVHFNLSPASGYRSRCEYGYKNNYYTMINNDKKIFLKTHILPSSSIQSVMEELLNLIKDNSALKENCFKLTLDQSKIIF